MKMPFLDSLRIWLSIDPMIVWTARMSEYVGLHHDIG